MRPRGAREKCDAVCTLGHHGLSPSAYRLEASIRTLAGFGTRHTLSDMTSDTRGIDAAGIDGNESVAAFPSGLIPR